MASGIGLNNSIPKVYDINEVVDTRLFITEMYYILTLCSIPSLTLLVHLFTLFASYDQVVLEIFCFVCIINVYFDIYIYIYIIYIY